MRFPGQKQLEPGVTLPNTTSSPRSAASHFEPGPLGSVHRAWDGPEPIGFPYLWNLNAYYSSRGMLIYTFKYFGDDGVACLGDGPGGWTIVRLWASGASLASTTYYKLWYYQLRTRGMWHLYGDPSGITPAMTVEEANQLGVRYIQILNIFGDPGVGIFQLDWPQFYQNHAGEVPPGFEDLLVCRSFMA